MDILSERMRLLRKEQNLKQDEAAAQIGISHRSYRRYEGEGYEPTASTIVLIARFYGVSSDYLLGLSDER